MTIERPRIYLDHSATTPLDPAARKAMEPFLSDRFGNPSSIHRSGQEARAALDEARAALAAVAGVSASEVIFTSGGTESDNLAIKGAATALRRTGKDHIVTAPTEHHAVMDTIEFLGSAGFEVTVLKVDGSGLIDPDDLRRAIRPSTGLISLMHVNNETGTIHPIAEIARIAAETGVTLHTDAVQSFCKIPSGSADALRLDEAPAGPRLVSISAHKVYGPKGIGALIRRGVSLDKTMHGGGQERGLRGGTENVAFAAAFAAAAAASAARAEAEFVRLGSLKKAFQQMLKERVPGVRFNGHPEKSIPHIVSISIEEGGLSGGSDRGKGGGEGVIDGETLLFGLDLEGICASGGSACTSGSVEPSHVLSAMGIPAATARATVRFSMGLSTTLEELERTATCLGDIVSQTLGLPAGRR